MSNFYLLFVVRKITLPTGETTYICLRAEQIANLQPQGSAICMGCQIISVCQISVSQLNPSILNHMVILFYFFLNFV